MNIEELLLERVLILIDFPQWSVFKHKKGDILIKKGIHYVSKNTAKSINENEIDNYPGVIRRVKWWEFREEKDMPKYAYDNFDTAERGIGKVFRVLERGLCIGYRDNLVYWKDCYPATEEEYLKRIEGKKLNWEGQWVEI